MARGRLTVNPGFAPGQKSHTRAAELGGAGGNLDNGKFQTTQRVRVAAEMGTPGKVAPDEYVMGMTGIVEAAGLVYGSGLSSDKYLLPAYFVRLEGIGPVLVGEEWL